MSTKTTFKRIALVAVASLGFGLLSAAPSSAAALGAVTYTTTVTSASACTVAVPCPQGTAITMDLKISLENDAADNDIIAATYVLTNPNGTVVTNGVFTTGTAPTDSTLSRTGQVYTLEATGALADDTAYTIGTLTFTPTMGGLYSLTNTQTLTTATQTASVLLAGTIGNATGGYYVSGVNVSQGTTRGNPGAAIAGNQAQVRVTYPEAEGTTYKVVSTGVGAIVGATPTDANNTNISGVSTDFSKGLTTVTTTNNTAHNNLLTLSSATAGDQTLTVSTVDATTGVATDLYSIVITWGGAPVVSTQYSAVRIGAGTTGNGTDITAATASDATVATTVSNATGTQRFTIRASTFDQNNVALSVASFGATITGPGLISIENDNSSTAAGNGRSVSTAAASNTATIAVWGDGSAGVSTITITATTAAGVTTTIGTKTVTFVGAPASITVTQNLFIARANTALGLATATTSRVAATANSITTTPAIRASVLDAAGNPVAAGAVVRIVSSNEAVIVPGGCAEYTTTGSSTTTTPAPGRFECVVSGAAAAASGSTATITFQVQDAATGLWSLSATPITFAIGGTIASVALATDKTSYAPGEAMVMTATARDSAGNLAADGLAPYASISTNMTVTGAPATTAIITNGVHTTTSSTGVKTMFAPSSVGNLVVSGLTTNASTGTAYSVALKIENAELDSALAAAADAAAEATDAANAATDAANAAAEAADAATAAAQDAADAVAALSTSVTAMVDTLRKQITSLTNLVIKIQKKVRA